MAWAVRSAAMGLAAFALAPAAAGQELPDQKVASTPGVQTFEPPYFSKFSPVTALDMVRQLPGFLIDNGDALRGFGSTAGNVLIDGQRPSSKTAISEELARIPARDIARVELIGAAAAGDIDVRGYAEIANVILKPATGIQISTTYSTLLGLEATLPLDEFGVKGGQLKFNGGAGGSHVTDPFTGQQRTLDNVSTYDWNLDFRQDVPELKLAWGGDYGDVGKLSYFRLEEDQSLTFGPGDLDLFVETTYFEGITVRLAADNLGVQPQRSDRRFFAPNRYPGGVFTGRELRDADNVTPIYTLSVSGSF